MAKPSPVTLVTGASTGIGHAIAVHLARCGHRVFAGMRAPAGGDIMGRKEAVGLAAMAATEDISIVPLVLEVTDEHSCADAVARIEETVGPIDVLVNNAGVGSSGAVEDIPIDVMRSLLETNVIGPAGLCRLVLPSMRQRRSGAIVNVSSLAGRIANPCHGGYAASKWALESVTECLAMEVSRFNIRVVLLEPGCITTPIWTQLKTGTWSAPRRNPALPYTELQLRSDRYFKKMILTNPQPTICAEAVAEALTSPQYKLRWPVGTDAVRMSQERAELDDAELVASGLEQTEASIKAYWRTHWGFDDFVDDDDQLHALLNARGSPPVFDPASMRLRPKANVLVTGSSTGIGKAICVKLARQGHRVLASMRGPADRPEAQELLQTAEREGVQIEVLVLDVSDAASRVAVVEDVLQRTDRCVDLLVNNAGLGGDSNSVEEGTAKAFRDVFEANFLGAVHLTQLLLPSMRARKSGCIVNLSSTHGRWTTGCHSVYCASKYALEAISEQLAQEVVRFGVRVVLLLPGVIITPIFGRSSSSTAKLDDEEEIQRRQELSAAYAPIRNAKNRFYEYGFSYGQGPDVVANVLSDALVDGSLRLRYVAGADVEPLIGTEGRGARHTTVTDEQHVALGAAAPADDDAEFVRYWREHYGLDLSGTTNMGLARKIFSLSRSPQGLDGARSMSPRPAL